MNRAASDLVSMQMSSSNGRRVHSTPDLLLLLHTQCCRAVSFPPLVGSGPFSSEWEGEFKERALKSPIVNSCMFSRRQLNRETPQSCFQAFTFQIIFMVGYW